MPPVSSMRGMASRSQAAPPEARLPRAAVTWSLVTCQARAAAAQARQRRGDVTQHAAS